MSRDALPALVMLLAVTAGCTSSGPGQPSPTDEPTVELVVHNEGPSAVTTFVQWEGFRATRLGDVGSGSSETFLPPFRAGALCIVSLARSTTSFGAAVPDRDPRECTTFVPVARGRRMDVFFRRNGTLCYLQHDPDC